MTTQVKPPGRPRNDGQPPKASAAAQQEMASRILARRRLLPFVQRMNPKYMAGWVHEDICRRLEKFSDDVAAGLSPRLMLLMPPRHGKSELASKMFPPWHMGRHPDHEVIACSYNISLAMGFSKKIKAVFDDPSYQTVFEARLDPDNRSTEEWGIHQNTGGYVAAGVGGGITGKGAHVLIIDDPIKNAEEADSTQVRESIWDWYGSTAYTRLAPGAGVLVIQCMTGETPVMLPDGTYRRLDELRAGDTVATFENGRLSSSTVAAWKSSGHDQILKITTTSGKIVRSNGRHPFLVSTDEGLKWIRARSLTTDHKIVALKGSGVSGKVKPAPPKSASCLPSAEGYALRITTSKNGQTGADRRPLIRSPAAQHTLSTATASPQKITPDYSPRRAASARSAVMFLLGAPQAIGATLSVSIIVTRPAKYGRSCVMIVTPQSDTFALNQSLSQRPDTCDFTEDQIASIELDGVEEVFDVQVNRTGNFIAGGLVSHNTWWHDDDLAGRLQQEMAAASPDDEDVDRFEIIKYPAIAEADEWLDTTTDDIVRITHSFDTSVSTDADGDTSIQDDAMRAAARAISLGVDVTNLQFLRAKGDCLHEARYDIKKLLRIKRTIASRFWSALFQQNPVPDDGAFFTKDQFKRGPIPARSASYVQIAWDFAISEKQHNDYTVGSVGLLDSDDVLHVVELLRFKSSDSNFIVQSILNLAERWYHPSLILGFEDGQIYRSISALLKKEMQKRRFYPRVEVLKPITDKKARASALQGRMQQGMFSFNETAEWYDTVRNEMLRFPAGVHDDCVDSLAWMTQLAIGREPPRKPEPPKQKSWKDRLRAGIRGGSHMAA